MPVLFFLIQNVEIKLKLNVINISTLIRIKVKIKLKLTKIITLIRIIIEAKILLLV
jgi:hypothetical protein